MHRQILVANLQNTDNLIMD